MTIPEPDISAYENYPRERRFQRGLKWNDVSPVIVVEVLVNGDPEKDLERNVELYLQVPSIREYWVLDGRIDPEQPSLIQYRKHGRKWIVRHFDAGTIFATKLLPGFHLLLDPLDA
jgi:Uma2 family endonuclease